LRAGNTPSFNRDVMAVLSKAGCNLGACHGNLNGKGGFRLSLRGENPAADFEALLRQVEQRRVNLLEPEASLILQKPTARVVHLGGLRFKRDSFEYAILRNWIAAGAPPPNDKEPSLVRLEVTPAGGTHRAGRIGTAPRDQGTSPMDASAMSRRSPFTN
jgi:hypothetical protein